MLLVEYLHGIPLPSHSILFFHFFTKYFLVHCRAGTVISETWEDGQALKDVNAHLVCSCQTFITFCITVINLYVQTEHIFLLMVVCAIYVDSSA